MAARDLTRLQLVGRLVALLREDAARRKLLVLMAICGHDDVRRESEALQRWRRRTIRPLLNEYERRRARSPSPLAWS